MEKTKKNVLKMASFLMFAVITIFAGIMLASCGAKETTKLELAFADENEVYEPGDSVSFIFHSDGELEEDDVELLVLENDGLVTVSGQQIVINSDATPGENVLVQAKYEEVLSNILTITISHIEATEVSVVAGKDTLYAGEIITLSATYLPTDATRDVKFEIVEGGDLAKIIDGNTLVIANDVTDADKISVIAKMGEVQSEPFEIQLKPIDEDRLIGLVFSEKEKTIDSTINSTTQNINVIAQILEDDLVEVNTNLATIEIESGEDVVNLLENNKIEALKNGVATLKLTYKDFTDTMTVTVRMTPDQVKLPENFEKDANYNYERAKPISFAMNVVNDHGNENYQMIVSGAENTTLSCTANEWSSDSENISYDGENLTIKNEGTYNITFRSNTGCAVEVESPTLKLTINNGKNVATKEEFISAFQSKEFPVVNLTADIYFADGHDSLTSYGDKALYGNGFKIDTQEQLTDSEYAYGRASLLNFVNADLTTPYRVIVEDLEIVGNMGLLTREEFMAYKGINEAKIEEKLNAGDTSYFTDTGYRWAINISAKNGIADETHGKYTYVIPYMNNITISKFNSGINIEHGIDEKTLGESERIAVNNITISNIFGDGLRNMGSHIHVGDINFGTIGGSPITTSNTDVTCAGLNRDEAALTNFDGNIICDNATDGSSLYIAAEIAAVRELQAIFKNGLSGVVNTLITQKVAELMAPYRGESNEREMQITIAGAKSNVLRDDKDSDKFNLLCFTRSGLNNYNFSNDNMSKMVDINDEFFYNGIDTTHKFVKINAYDLVMSIETLGSLKDVIEANADALKPIDIILINFNYQAN